MKNITLPLACLFLLSCATVTSKENAPAGSKDIPVLVNAPRYTGMKSIKNDNDYKGGYYYADLTEDGLTQIINTAFLTTQKDGDTLKSYIEACAKQVSGADSVRELRFIESAELSKKLTYPAYLAEWLMGQNEDTRVCYAIFMKTDTHTYMYIHDIHGDSAEERVDLVKAAMEQIKLSS